MTRNPRVGALVLGLVFGTLLGGAVGVAIGATAARAEEGRAPIMVDLWEVPACADTDWTTPCTVERADPSAPYADGHWLATIIWTQP